MGKIITIAVLFAGFSLLFFTCFRKASKKPDVGSSQPAHITKQGNTTQLIVDGKPFIVLGGELGNSTFTSPAAMEPVWPKLKAMHINTVLAPVYWELVEPEEGHFDFSLYETLIVSARNHDLKLILLWFGAWKNSMSSHAPAWVKTDQQRFPRAQDKNGISQEILTPFSEENLLADTRAYEALMAFLKEVDGLHGTVIMVQTENEIGMLPSARDHSHLANKAFFEDVPEDLMEYLVSNKESLVPEFNAYWGAGGYKESGTWEEIFGSGPHTDEVFMAWHYARFINHMIEAGKAVYPLPMFVNAALNRPGRLPGEYPSAGPLPHIMDIWQAGGPEIDFLAPDFYNPDFKHWCDLYTRQGNPLFIPEHVFDETAAAKAAFAFGQYEAMGFAPFSIESTDKPGEEPIGKLYKLLDNLMPVITANHGRQQMRGILVDKNNPVMRFSLGDYTFEARHSHVLGYEGTSRNETWIPAGAILVQTADNEFFLAGSGVVLTFSRPEKPETITGILKADEGWFDNGKWKVYRHLNGDQTHQGRHIRIFLDDFSIQRFELYDYY